MSRHPFGWDLPPGVTNADIDRAAGADEEPPDPDFDEVPEPPPFYTVALVLHDRAYGGPEEGGWYYETYELTHWAHPELPEFLPVAARTIEEATKLRDKMNSDIGFGELNQGRREISSVLSEGRYEAHIFEGFPKNEPQTRPHYE